MSCTNAFSWSYRQLIPAVARVFRLLGVHPGHDMDAHAVAGTGLRDARRALDVLVRTHLVDQPSGGRYQPHDLLRVYAAELARTADDTTGPLAWLFGLLPRRHVRRDGRHRPARARTPATAAGCFRRRLDLHHHKLGDHGSARRHLDSALRIARSVGVTDQLVAALNARAAAHTSAEELAEARQLYDEALAAENGHGHRDEYAHALAGIGDVHDGLGEHDRAREYWGRALVIYRELGMPHADAMTARVGGA